MYALPSRQRSRNNYSRTLLADRTSDMLPQLSRKQLLSVKELLIANGLVNRVIVRDITFSEMLKNSLPSPNGRPGSYLIRQYDPGLRLIRTVIFHPPPNTFDIAKTSYALNSKPDGSGQNFGGTDVIVGDAASIQWPTPVSPSLIYSDPPDSVPLSNVGIEGFEPLVEYKSQPVSGNYLRYYPFLLLHFLGDIENKGVDPDFIMVKLYYLN